MTTEPGLCCFCGIAVPWDCQVRVSYRGTERIAHASCATQLPIPKVRREDRNKVIAIGFGRVGKGTGLGLTPRRARKAGAKC